MTAAFEPITPAAAPVLDREVLDANTLGDRALQKELFDLYFGHAAQAMTRMRAALDNADPVTWAASAHGVKGTARTLGLLRLGEVAAEAEASAARGPSALTEARLSALAGALTSATAAAHAYLAQAPLRRSA